MAKKANLFRGFDDKALPVISSVTVEPESIALVNDVSLRQKSRQGKKVVTFYLDPEPFTQLKILSAKTGVTIQDLSLDALNLLFEKYQISKIAR